MIMRQEFLIDTPDGAVVYRTFDHPNLGGWESVPVASAALRGKAAWLKPVALICGGYETTIQHPNRNDRERVTFWADEAA